MLPDIDRFDRLWHDKGRRVRVYNVSDAFTKGLIRNAPHNGLEFQKLSAQITDELLQRNSAKYDYQKKVKKIRLRDYQDKAITNWLNNDYKGIFEMATGTGKTFTAFGCVKHLLEKEKNLDGPLFVRRRLQLNLCRCCLSSIKFCYGSCIFFSFSL